MEMQMPAWQIIEQLAEEIESRWAMHRTTITTTQRLADIRVVLSKYDLVYTLPTSGVAMEQEVAMLSGELPPEDGIRALWLAGNIAKKSG